MIELALSSLGYLGQQLLGDVDAIAKRGKREQAFGASHVLLVPMALVKHAHRLRSITPKLTVGG